MDLVEWVRVGLWVVLVSSMVVHVKPSVSVDEGPHSLVQDDQDEMSSDVDSELVVKPRLRVDDESLPVRVVPSTTV